MNAHYESVETPDVERESDLMILKVCIAFRQQFIFLGRLFVPQEGV